MTEEWKESLGEGSVQIKWKIYRDLRREKRGRDDSSGSKFDVKKTYQCTVEVIGVDQLKVQ